LNGISDISRHSEVSDIRSLTDSNSYHTHKETDLVNLNARGRDCERLALYAGITLFIYSKKRGCRTVFNFWRVRGSVYLHIKRQWICEFWG